MVPFTSKAFFEGKLKPEVCPNENHGTHKLEPKDEGVLLSLGGEYYAQMNRKQATDLLGRRIKEMRDKAKHDSSTNMAETESIINSVPNKISTENKLKFSKGFLLDQPTKNTEMMEQKIRRQSEDGNAQSCDETSRSTLQEPATIDSDAILPRLEIREEFDAYGNEIKAEAIDIANELLTLHRTIRNQSSIANSSTCLQELHQSFLSENSNNMSSSTYDIEEAEDEEQVEGVKQRVTDTQYQAICSRLDELMLKEECYEHDKTINKKSSKSLQGKGWSSGFFTNAKKKKNGTIHFTTQSSSSYAKDKKITKEVNEEVQQQEARKKVVSFRENISDTRYISPTSYVSVPSVELQQTSMQVVAPAHPKGTKEMKAGSTINSISGRNSGSLFSSTIQQRQCKDSNYPEVVPLTQGHDIFSGYVMERPVPNMYSTATNDIFDGARDSSNNTSSKTCTTNNKKLSRFARQRREQAK
jgi:hypothetical protein